MLELYALGGRHQQRGVFGIPRQRFANHHASFCRHIGVGLAGDARRDGSVAGQHGVGITELIAGARDIRPAAGQCYGTRCVAVRRRARTGGRLPIADFDNVQFCDS